MLLTIATLVLRRILLAIPVMLAVSALLFVTLRLLPIDPAALSMPPTATRAQIEAKRVEMGLDKPLPVQFYQWLERTIGGDLGESMQKRRPVGDLIADALPQTVELAVLAMIIASVLGLLGARAMFRWRHSRVVSAIMELGSIALLSMPDFLWGLLFILIFGVFFDVLPFTGRLSPEFERPVITHFLLLDTLLVGRPDMTLDALKHMILPAFALGLAFAPTITRVLFSSLLDVYQEDYIQQARFRGFSERRILRRHAFPNALVPTLNLMGVQFGFLFGGTLLIEVIYSYPGLGNLMVDAVQNADLPIIQTAGLTYGLTVVIITIVVDIASLLANPRLRR
jgi:ABC-type dipeptide/oligopeptide/nickel transport system permease component